MTRALTASLARLEAAMLRHGLTEAELADASGGLRLRLGQRPGQRPGLGAPTAPAIPVRAGAAGRFEPLRQAGETVAAGEILATLASGAILRPVVAPVSGRLGAWHGTEDKLIGYGDVVAEIGTERNT